MLFKNSPIHIPGHEIGRECKGTIALARATVSSMMSCPQVNFMSAQMLAAASKDIEVTGIATNLSNDLDL